MQLFNPIIGLTCRSLEGGLECDYTCPNGTLVTFLYADDPTLSFTKKDLDRTFCSTNPQLTPTAAATRTPVPMTPTAIALRVSPTAEPSSTAPVSLLSGSVTLCDLSTRLINFRIAEPIPDLAGRTLNVQIQAQESICRINPGNPSILTCSIPRGVFFPVSILVRLDGVVVNDFTYRGLECLAPRTATPQSYP